MKARFITTLMCLIQDAIDIKCRHNVSLCLICGFNGRTGVLADYLEEEYYVVSDLIGLNFCNDNVLSTLNNSYVTTSRNVDVQVNINGNQVLAMCKSLDFAIVNGRIGEDGSFVNFTCDNKNRGRSTIDYFLVSHKLYHTIQNLKVDLFEKCLTDVHCPIVVTLKANDPNNYDMNASLRRNYFINGCNVNTPQHNYTLSSGIMVKLIILL